MPLIHKGGLALLALSMLAACQSDPAPDGEPRSVYRHALDGVPGSLDPAHAADVYSATVVVNLFDTLYRYRYLARPHELAPNLASAFPQVSDDGLDWRIELRTNARFIDDPAFDGGAGRTVTAEDVVYSLKRHFMPETRSRGAWLWRDRIEGLAEWTESGASPDEPVSGLQALDPHTVRIRLTKPYPQLTHTLAMALSAIVPREAVEYHGREFGVRPVGSGPFRLDRLDETMARLVPNPYFDRPPLNLADEGYQPEIHQGLGLEPLEGRKYPFLDRLEIHFITEPTARWSSFIAGGEVDNVMVPPDQAARVLSQREPLKFRQEIESRYHVTAEPEAGLVFYGFNMANPEIGHNEDAERDRRNRALRCAMRDAFDWEARNETFYHGLGRVFPGVIPPFLDEFDDRLSLDSITRDPDHARRRLESHNWTSENLPRLTYGLESSVHQRQMFEQFRSQMGEAGIPGDRLRQQTFAGFADYSRAIANRRLDLFLFGWTMAYPDAQYNLQLFYGPNAAPGANSSNYDNPEFDRLFRQAATMEPGDERARIHQAMNRMIIDDCVIIGSLSRTRLHLWHRNVRMKPDREIVGGYFLRFVDIGEDLEPTR